MPISLPWGGADSLFFLLVALVVNALFGGFSFAPLRAFHPEVLFGHLAGWFDRRLNREKRSERNRTIRGALVVLMLVGFAVVLGFVLLDFMAKAAFGRYVEILLLAVLVPVRQIFDEGRSLARALKADRFSPSQLSFLAAGSKDDSHRYARLGIARLAVRFGKDVAGPIFWFVLLGLPGVFLARAARVLGDRLGNTGPRHLAFGFAARRFDAAIGLLPVRLAGFVIMLAAFFTATANPVQSLRVLKSDRRKHPDFNAGWPVAAMAGALDLALQGPGSGKDGRETPWIGSGRARAGFGDIRRALYLFTVAGFVLFGLVAALAYAL